MPATPLDSAIYRDLFGDAELGRLFTDSAEVRAMLLVEGALARAQGAVGMIPQDAADAIHRAGLDAVIDPATLAAGAGRSAVPVPALVTALRAALGSADHAQWVHFGATSQDIVDTALALRLRQACGILEARLRACLNGLADLSVTHADLPMPGRTYGQAAVPTSFGAVAAEWGRPLLTSRGTFADVRAAVETVSLSGAAGTLAAMAPHGPAVRAGLARDLGLSDPGASRHADRGAVSALAAWCAGLCATLGRIGEDLILLTSTEVGEVRLSDAGGSSTMPQKANPVAPSALSAVSKVLPGLVAALSAAAVHRQQRDGAAWMAEWLVLPQILLLTGRALLTAERMIPGLAPVPDRMRANLQAGSGTIMAEAIAFALAQVLPRPEAQARVASWSERALATGVSLARIAAEEAPDLPPRIFDPAASLGTAPDDARAFAGRARSE